MQKEIHNEQNTKISTIYIFLFWLRLQYGLTQYCFTDLAQIGYVMHGAPSSKIIQNFKMATAGHLPKCGALGRPHRLYTHEVSLDPDFI